MADGDLVEYSLLDNERRTAQSWRRAFFSSMLVIVGMLSLVFFLTTRDHSTPPMLYKEDASGDIALIGAAGSNLHPADLSVKHQLALWLTYIRGIPGDNADLVNANVNKMFTMIQKDSQATVAARDYLTTQNPLTFAKAGITRTIIKVEVSKVGDLAYRIAWQERTSKRGSPDPYQAFSGTVQLAQPPAVPADPVIGQENPAGIYIKSYDLPWSTL